MTEPFSNISIHDIEFAYADYDKQIRLKNIRLEALLIIILVPFGLVLDYVIYPDQFKIFLISRLLTAFLALLFLILCQTDFFYKHYRFWSLMLPLLPIADIAWMIYMSQGAASPYYAGLNLVLLGVGLIFPWTFFENLIVGSCVILIYAMACFFHPGNISVNIFINNLYFLILTDVIVIIASYFQSRLRFQEFSLRYKLDQSQKLLEKSYQQLLELDRLKSNFFANVSHELRTPLTLLISPLEDLRIQKSKEFDEKTNQILNLMSVNAQRLLRYINDILDLIKLESQKMPFNPTPTDIPTFIRGLLLSLNTIAESKNIMLDVQFDPSLILIEMDQIQLEKIILNLVFNSIKFTPPEGRITVISRYENQNFILSVEDTGQGIAPENISKIFDRFWKADPNTSYQNSGTGLGLSIVKELVDAQHGTIQVESVLNQKTQITVSLPCHPSPLNSTTPELKNKKDLSPLPLQQLNMDLHNRILHFSSLFPSPSESLATQERSTKPLILIIDDEPDMREFLRLILKSQFKILEANDGHQGIHLAIQNSPEIILLDMMLPGKNGIDVCHELFQHKNTETIPVIMLTARADDEMKIEALNAGATDFLTKPFSILELKIRIKNILQSHEFQKKILQQKTDLELMNQKAQETLELLKQTQSQLIQHEKMASLGTLSAGIIHEINNPLNYVLQALYLLKQKYGSPTQSDKHQILDMIEDMEEGLDRVQKIISNLKSFAHPNAMGKDWFQVHPLISTTLTFIQHEIPELFQIDVQIPSEHFVLVNKNRIIQVLLNLIQNALTAMKNKNFNSDEKPTLQIQSRFENNFIFLHIRDNGTGIAPENISKVFDPFFTTKDVGEGLGLGLSICYQIIKDQNGRITVQSESGKFTEFTIQLPGMIQLPKSV